MGNTFSVEKSLQNGKALEILPLNLEWSWLDKDGTESICRTDDDPAEIYKKAFLKAVLNEEKADKICPNDEPANEKIVAWKGQCNCLKNVLAEKERQLDGIKEQVRQKAVNRRSAKTELEALMKAVGGISFNSVGEGSEKFEKEDEIAEVEQILSQLNRQFESLSDNMQIELEGLNDEFLIWREQCAELQNTLEENMEKLKVIKMKSPSAKADIEALIMVVEGISFEEVSEGAEKFEKEDQVAEVDQICGFLNRQLETLLTEMASELEKHAEKDRLEKLRLAEEEKSAEEEKKLQEEQRRKSEEKARIAEEETARVAEESRKRKEAARIAIEQLAIEEAARNTKEESARIAEEKRQQEESARVAEGKRKHEEAARIAEKKRQQEEAAIIAEKERKQEEAARIAEEKRKQEDAARIAEEKLRQEKASIAEASRKHDEAARIVEEKLKQEEAVRIAEEKRNQEEAARIAEEKRKHEEEAARIAEEKRKHEEEAARIAEEKRKHEEEARVAEEKRKHEVKRKQEEVERIRLEQERKKQEEERLNNEFSIWREQCAELQNILEGKMDQLQVIKMKSPSAKADIEALIKEVDGISFQAVGEGSEKFEKEEQISEVDQILAHLNRLFESLVDDLQKEHAKLNDEFSIWKVKCEALGKVLEEKEAEFNHIKKEIRKKHSDILSSNANLKALITAVEGTSFEEVSEGAEQFDKEDQLAEVDQICGFLNCQLETLLTEMASELEGLNDEFAIWKVKCGALGKVLEEKEVEFNHIKKQLRQKNSDVVSAKANLEALIKAVEGTSFEEVSEGAENFEKEDQLAEVDQICGFLNRQLETLLTEMASELEGLNDEFSIWKVKCGALGKVLEEREVEFNHIKTQVRKENSDVLSAKANLEALIMAVEGTSFDEVSEGAEKFEKEDQLAEVDQICDFLNRQLETLLTEMASELERY